MELSPVLVEQLIYGAEGQRRRTQDSPVLPDVWAYYATPSAEPGRPNLLGPPADESKGTDSVVLDLLLTPYRDAGPARLATEVRRRLERARKGSRKRRAPPRIAYTQAYVVARLAFDDVIRVLLPLTPWWRDFVWRDRFKDEDGDTFDDRALSDVLEGLEPSRLVDSVEAWSRTQAPDRYPPSKTRPADLWKEGDGHLRDDLLWMIRLVGAIRWAQELTARKAKAQGVTIDAWNRVASLPLAAAAEDDPDRRVDYRPLVKAAQDVLLESDLSVLEAPTPSLWLVNRNRHASRAVEKSRRAVKADAATQLFDIRCNGLTWAIVDSGVDATHPAFLHPADDGAPWHRRTRVDRTYDFTRIRPLLDQEVVRELLEAENVVAQSFRDPGLDDQLAGIRVLLHREDTADAAREESGASRLDPSRGRLRTQLRELSSRLQTGREIDWELLDPLLRVHHDETYERPISGHGTHVAGILAANWKAKGLQGICPDIRLYDLRVLDPHGPNDEFTVLGALQFVQYLNKQRETLIIQGANLSLSIRHAVTNYACGRTPVCEECERLVASGVVVVAAAGNAGWDDDLARAAVGAGYRVVSITDPGNGEGVITVGATHRNRPHSYGVSFFSSRGPTGDGRSKPDLVAPGEKITSTVPGGAGLKREDGTSMAAPHVSGAAALLMARHRELIGSPRRIKEILCGTATDLGRERQFQGAGMLDVLRALQSI